VGDIYESFGNDVYPEFSSLSDDRVLAVKTHFFTQHFVDELGYKRALVSTLAISGNVYEQERNSKLI